MKKENVNQVFDSLIQEYFSELKDMQINIDHQKEKDKGVIHTQVEPDPNEYTICIYPEALEYTEQALRASLALELSKIIYGLPDSKGVMRHKIAVAILIFFQITVAALIAIPLAHLCVEVIATPYKMAAWSPFFVLITVGLVKGSTWFWVKYVYKTAACNAWAEAHLIERNLGEDLLQLRKEYHCKTAIMFAEGMSMKEIKKAIEEKRLRDLEA